MNHLRAGLIGHPVAHSLSPALHAAAGQAVDWRVDYALIDVAPDALSDRWDSLLELDGFNITAPHKIAALQRVDDLSEAAEQTGAVNTIRCVGQRVIGTNTDVDGFASAWGALRPGRIIVLGSGGAARAVVVALGRSGHTVEVYSRTAAPHVAALADGHHFPLSALESGMYEATGLVNCLPPLPFVCDLPFDRLLARARVVDLNYGARAQPVVEAAAAAGCETSDGLAMLAAQGCAAFRFWTGQDPPFPTVLNALRAATSRAH